MSRNNEIASETLAMRLLAVLEDKGLLTSDEADGLRMPRLAEVEDAMGWFSAGGVHLDELD